MSTDPPPPGPLPPDPPAPAPPPPAPPPDDPRPNKLPLEAVKATERVVEEAIERTKKASLAEKEAVIQELEDMREVVRGIGRKIEEQGSITAEELTEKELGLLQLANASTGGGFLGILERALRGEQTAVDAIRGTG